MRKYLDDHCDGIDAAVFSGDVLWNDDEREELKEFVSRWSKAIYDHEAIAAAEHAQQAKPAAQCQNCLGTKKPHTHDPEWRGRCECATQPPAVAVAVPDGYAQGIEAVVKMLEKKASDYASKYGHDYMGSVSFAHGRLGDQRQDYHSGLIELAEEARAMLAAAPQAAPQAAAECTCKECGGTNLTWHTSNVIRSNVQQGRLNTNDVECLFYLGCDDCSETLITLRADKVAGMLGTVAAAQKGGAT